MGPNSSLTGWNLTGNNNDSLYLSGGVSKTSTYILIASYAVLIPIIVAGNLLIIISYIKFERMKTVAHMLICSLAVSDIVMGVIAMPLYIMIKLVPSLLLDGKFRYVLTRKAICTAWLISYLTPGAVSIMTLLAIATLLFISIIWPFKFMTLVTHQRARILISCIWTYILLLCMPMLIWNDNKEGELCAMENLPGWYFKPVIFIHIFIPYATMIVMYVLIHRKIKSIAKWRMTSTSIGRAPANQRASVKMASFMTVAVALFLICWSPILVMYPLAGILGGTEVFDVLYYYATLLAFVSSAVNPILYSTMNKDYRQAFKQILGRSKSTKFTESVWSTRSMTSTTSMTEIKDSQQI